MAQDMKVGTTDRPGGESPMAGGQPANGEQGSGKHRQDSGRPGGRQAADREDSRALLPRCDVLEDSQGITLLADLPGVPRDRLELKVDGDTLLIEGAVSTAMPQQMAPTYVEVRVPRFRRAFTLSRELDTGKIDASLADGVLRLRIPKKAQAQPRKIAVQSGRAAQG